VAALEVKNIRKEFDIANSGKLLLFEDISFKFEENEQFVSILSPFGSGKSSLLRIISGIEPPTSGEVLLNGNNYSINSGKIVLIPEEPSSFPWLSVRENIELVSKRDNINEIIKLIGLDGYEDHYPDHRSFGFRFRIAVGRAVSISPAFILIDDTMKRIDFTTKTELYQMLRNIAEVTGIKFLMTTTDISDAVQLSERILIMKKKPSEIVSEFKVMARDKNSLMGVIGRIEDIFQKSDSNKSINFTI
jgi:ABC-type nitrate/sulfonate/bicarbonate transport system ATPase subunit